MLFLTGPPAAEAATSLKLPINLLQFQSRYNVVSSLNFICNMYFTGKARRECWAYWLVAVETEPNFLPLLLPCAVYWITGSVPAVPHPGGQMPWNAGHSLALSKQSIFCLSFLARSFLKSMCGANYKCLFGGFQNQVISLAWALDSTFEFVPWLLLSSLKFEDHCLKTLLGKRLSKWIQDKFS